MLMNQSGASAEQLAGGSAVEAPAAGRDEIRRDAVTDIPALDALAERCDAADGLHAEDVREPDRKPGNALSDVDVEMVERRGRDVDDDLVHAWRRIRQLLDAEDVAVAELVEDDRPHALAPLSRSLYVVFKSDIRDSVKGMAHLQTARSFRFAPGSD